MTALANTDITTTVLDSRRYGQQRQTLVKMAFGDSSLTYPSGGLALPSASSLGLARPLFAIQILDCTDPTGTDWKYDYAAGKLRAYRNVTVPPIVIDEAVTLTSHAGTLRYPPAYIITTRGTVAAATVPLKVVPHTATVGAAEMTINWTTGAVTCKASDSVTGLLVSYIPQQPYGLFSAANLVVNEEIELSTDKVNLDYRAAAIQYIYQTEATAVRLVLGHAVASDVVLLDINDSGNTSFDCHSDDNEKTAVVTYLKYSGIAENAGVVFTDQASIALTSEAIEWGVATFRKSGLYLPGTGTQIIGCETTNYLPIWLMDGGATDGPGKATFDILAQKIVTDETSGQTTIEDTPLLYYNPSLITPTSGPQELQTTQAPAATEIYALCYS